MKHDAVRKRPLVLKGVAWPLNLCGSAIVCGYNLGASGLSKIRYTGKKPSEIFKGLFPKKRPKISKALKARQRRLDDLYFELGRMCVESADLESAVLSEAVQELLTKIKDLKANIGALKNAPAEDRDEERAKGVKGKPIPPEGESAPTRIGPSWQPMEEARAPETAADPVQKKVFGDERVKQKHEPPGGTDLCEENLKKMVKPRLLLLCKGLNIECDITDPKDLIIEKIIRHSWENSSEQ